MNQSDFLIALGWAVLNSIWQFALLWVMFQVFISIRPRTQSTTKSAVASGMVLAGFAWMLYTFFSLFFQRSNSFTETISLLNTPAGWNHWIADLLPVASIIYLLLLLVPLYRYFRNYRYVQIIRSNALHKADVKWRLFVQRLSEQMGVRKKVELWISDLVHSPVTIGYLRPVILLPVAAVNHLSAGQVEAVLLHELAHIRRFDYLLNLIVRFIQSLLYFNPFVKAFVRIIETEREKSCDEMVMQFQYDAHDYASALLTIEKATGVKSQVLAVAASGSQKQQLLGRVENILGVKRNKGLTGMRLAGIMLAISCMAIMHLLLQWKKPGTIGYNDQFAYISAPLLLYPEGKSNRTENPESSYLETLAVNDPTPTTTGMTTVDDSDYSETPGVEEIETEEENNSDEKLSALPVNLLHYISGRENVLTLDQEAEIKKALQASQRVLEEMQWKATEKKLADALSSVEKEIVREQLEKENAKIDFTTIESNLRKAYSQINWPALNNELEVALSHIRLDSLQSVYTNAIDGLAALEKELALSELKTVPDTDISLKNISAKRKLLESLITELKAKKVRKIVRL